MFRYTTFETDDSTFRLFAIIYNGQYCIPTLCTLIDDKIHDEVNSIKYLLEIYKYLKDDPNADPAEIDDIESSYSSHKKELLEMFNEANKLGFFKL